MFSPPVSSGRSTIGNLSRPTRASPSCQAFKHVLLHKHSVQATSTGGCGVLRHLGTLSVGHSCAVGRPNYTSVPARALWAICLALQVEASLRPATLQFRDLDSCHKHVARQAEGATAVLPSPAVGFTPRGTRYSPILPGLRCSYYRTENSVLRTWRHSYAMRSQHHLVTHATERE